MMSLRTQFMIFTFYDASDNSTVQKERRQSIRVKSILWYDERRREYDLEKASIETIIRLGRLIFRANQSCCVQIHAFFIKFHIKGVSNADKLGCTPIQRLQWWGHHFTIHFIIAVTIQCMRTVPDLRKWLFHVNCGNFLVLKFIEFQRKYI